MYTPTFSTAAVLNSTAFSPQQATTATPTTPTTPPSLNPFQTQASLPTLPFLPSQIYSAPYLPLLPPLASSLLSPLGSPLLHPLLYFQPFLYMKPMPSKQETFAETEDTDSTDDDSD